MQPGERPALFLFLGDEAPDQVARHAAQGVPDHGNEDEFERAVRLSRHRTEKDRFGTARNDRGGNESGDKEHEFDRLVLKERE